MKNRFLGDMRQEHRAAFPRRGYFVTGCDTDVGKTWVSCQILREMRRASLRVGAYKPVASGVDELVDADFYHLWQAIDCAFPIEFVCPQMFHPPLAPPMAARKEGKAVDAQQLWRGLEWWGKEVDWVLVEGAGGFYSPITEDATNADLAQAIGYPLILVVDDRLGAIHRALQLVEIAHHRQCQVAALILNETQPHRQPEYAEHAAWIRRFLAKDSLPVPPIFPLAHGPAQELGKAFLAELLDFSATASLDRSNR